MSHAPDPITLEDVLAAADRIEPFIQHTACVHSLALSELFDCDLYCKLEYRQRTGSFKERGAANALLLLTEAQRSRGVIAASAGNHALALAAHGQAMGIAVTVVMPRVAPLTKIANCRRLGAEVILEGQTIDDAYQHARSIVADRGLTYINGFDDPAIIAGQGTIGLEVMEQVPGFDAVVVPIGGAGLIAGIALAVKSKRPEVQVIGVEPRRAASYGAAIKAGKPVKIDMTSTLADGLAVPRVGDHAFAVARRCVDRVVEVRERDIARAVLRLLELERAVVEGAGAAGIAALLAGALPGLKGKKVVVPLCGGNIDTPVIDRVIERGLVADGRLCRFDAVISDRPGGLAKLAEVIAEQGASIKDLSHDRAFAGESIDEVVVHCVVETHDEQHIAELRRALDKAGFPVDFSRGRLMYGGEG